MMFHGEKEAIRNMLRDAEIYGFGNFISCLKRAWMNRLIENHNCSEEQAKAAADVDPYSSKGLEEITKY